MNERIKELAAQAGLDAKEIRDDKSLTLYAFEEFDIERFAELVRQDYIEEMNGHTLKMVMIAIEREREACAKLCDDWGHDLVEGNYAAKTIRAKSEPNPAFKNYMGDNWAGIV